MTKKTCRECRNITPKPNWLGLTKWKLLHEKITISCCDCGLAHDFIFKNFGGKIKWRAKRNKETTRLNRKTFTLKPKKK